MNSFPTCRGTEWEVSTRGPDPFGIVRVSLSHLRLEAANMNKDENVRQAVLELIASDPEGDWDIASLCTRIYGHADPRQYYVIRRATAT